MKQGRAMKKAERERELAFQKAADLDVLRQELKTLTKKRDGLTAHVEKQEMYPCYVDEVVQRSEQVMRDTYYSIRWRRPISPYRGVSFRMNEEARRNQRLQGEINVVVNAQCSGFMTVMETGSFKLHGFVSFLETIQFRCAYERSITMVGRVGIIPQPAILLTVF